MVLKGKKRWGRALTFTEWLWKSVTTISFLLFTATKWGPENIKWVSRAASRKNTWFCYETEIGKWKITLFDLSWEYALWATKIFHHSMHVCKWLQVVRVLILVTRHICKGRPWQHLGSTVCLNHISSSPLFISDAHHFFFSWVTLVFSYYHCFRSLFNSSFCCFLELIDLVTLQYKSFQC